MECRECGAQNPEDQNFCGECGARLNLACPSCKSPNPPDKKFCGECGAALTDAAPDAAAPPKAPAKPKAPATPKAEAERRQVTVMFVDLVGSTALSGRLDPEDLREVMRRYQDAAAGAITRYGGHVAKFLGDGVLAYFGWPQAYEDQAERAVRAGLDAVEAVQGMTADGGALHTRVGIATGEVVIGDMVGEETSESDAIVGETPNLAARLQGIAKPDQVVIGAATRRLVGESFTLDDLGARKLKGIKGKVPAWRVSGVRAAESRFEAAHAGRLTAFVGRDEEVDLLLKRWHQAKAGEGQVVLLSGEAGIGKSRITQRLRERLAGEVHTRLRYQCSPFLTSTAFHPFIRQLERAARLAPDDTAEAKLDKIEALLALSTESVADVAPLVAALLSVPTGDRYPPLDLAPPQQKARTLAALCDQITGLAARQPVLIIVEDVHWIDPTSLEALEQVIDRIQGAPVLAVITCRPEFTPPWSGHTHSTALTLNRLGREPCAAMIQSVTAGKALPAVVLEQIVAKTDGVPLFVEELTKTVLESGLLEEKGDRYELKGPLPPLAIPSTLQDSLMARLDRFAPVKELAQIGAAIGRSFSQRLLAAVSPLGGNELENALAQLVESELVFRRGAPPDASYIFKHALVQDTAYGSLLKSRRQQLHQRIAEFIERDFPETVETQPEILAHHYTEAGLVEPAIPYWHQAGQRAAERSANVEAIAHLSKGLEILDNLAESPERDKIELGLRLSLGPALMAIKGFMAEDVGTNYARAREIAERVGDSESLFTALYGQWQYNNVKGAYTVAKEIADDLIVRTEDDENTGHRLQAHHCNWTSGFFIGMPKSCRHHAETGAEIYDKEEHRAHKFVYGAHDPAVCALVFNSVSSWQLGHPDGAVSSMKDGLALAEELAHPFSNMIAHAFAMLLHHFRGETEKTVRYGKAGTAIAAEHGFGSWGPYFQAIVGSVRALKGDGDAAIAAMRDGIQGWQATGSSMFSPWFLALDAETDASAGKAQQGLEKLAEALALGVRSGEHWTDAELHRLKGELLLGRSARNKSKAEASFQAALEVARAQEAKSLELRAATSLARLWGENKRGAEARDLLAPVYGWFTEGFDTPDLVDAKELLDGLA